MEQSTNVVRLRQPEEIDDPLTEVLRAGARQLLAQAVELEVEAFLAERADLKLLNGRARLVRHGHGPEREMQTGIGAVAVARPKIRDRGAAEGGERVRFTSTISRRRSRRCWAKTPRTCLTRSSAASRPSGRPTMSAGRRGTCRRAVTCMSGPTGSTSRPEWRNRPSVGVDGLHTASIVPD